jgi:GPH family glycoside/pentoside/hexuronide:cation symporter
MLVTSVGFGATFLLGEGDWLPLVVIAAILGLAAGCGNIVGPSIQADIIDWDEHRTGERKEGAYFAAWNFCLKLATGITLGLTGVVLQLAGFRPNAAQDPQALLAIRSLYALFPLVCYAVGAIAFLRFSFNEVEYASVRRDLEARKRAAREAPGPDAAR